MDFPLDHTLHIHPGEFADWRLVYDTCIILKARLIIRAFVVPCALGVTAFAVLGCSRSEDRHAAAPAEQLVTVVSPVVRDLPRYMRVTGTLYGDEETTIAAKVAGRIVQIMKDLGDEAQPGEPLLKVDPTDYQLALIERQRALAESLAKLGLTDLPNEESFEIRNLPSVQRAHLTTENARAKLERARVLAEREPPLISQQDFADLQTAFDVAQSNLMVERLTAQATLAEAHTLQAQVDVAQQRVTDCVHRAPQPIAGTESSAGSDRTADRRYAVAARFVTVGDYVQVGDSLLRLVDSDPLRLRVPVLERRAGEVRIGQVAMVKLDAFPEPFEGRVSRISPAVELATRAFTVEIAVANPTRSLKPGMFASAHIEISRARALMLPQSAVSTFAGVDKIMLVNDGKAVERRVQLGDAVDGLVEVRSGVTQNDSVILKPAATLTNGSPVRAELAFDQPHGTSEARNPLEAGATR